MEAADLAEIIYQFQLLVLFLILASSYVLYYVFFVAHKPRLICREGKFKELVKQHCGKLLGDYYWPTLWCFGAHAMTIARALLRTRPFVPYRREYLDAPDGGVINLDWFDNDNSCYTDPASRPTVLILPGITGSSEVSYSKHLVLEGEKLGFRTVVCNNRGFGSCLRTPRTFSACNTEDLHFVLHHIHKTFPECPILAFGVSMGGVILVTYLAEMGTKGLDSGLVAAMAISVPWDCQESTISLEQPINAFLFNRPLARNLISMIKRNFAVFEEHMGKLPYDIHHVLKSRTVREFDQRFTCPTFGYPSYEEYYQHASLCKRPLEKIQIPVLFLNAADDPFSPLHAIPMDTILKSPLLALVLTTYGGHIGFTEGFSLNTSNFMDKLFILYASGIFSEFKRDGLVNTTKDL